MQSGTPRIPPGIKDFNDHINSVGSYIMLQNLIGAFLTNGVRIGLTQAEITKICDIKVRWGELMLLYTDKKGSRTPLVTETLMLIIKEYKDLNRKNNLYDRIAVNPNAILADFTIFNIKRSTPLASVKHVRAPETGTKIVGIVLMKYGHLFHELLVTNPEQEGRAKEDGVKEIMVFKAVGLATEVAPDLDAFHYIGDVNRGIITVDHTIETLGMKAWYYACVKNSRGEIGKPSEIVGFIIT